MNIYGSPTISVGFFGKVLAAAKSPVLAERPAKEYYDAFVAGGLDPAFGLAVFCKESSYATNPLAVVLRYSTKNWCNARSVRKPGLQIVEVVETSDRGNFEVPQLAHGVIDFVYRLTPTPPTPTPARRPSKRSSRSWPRPATTTRTRSPTSRPSSS